MRVITLYTIQLVIPLFFKQLLTMGALEMMSYRHENTDIDQGEISVFLGRYYIMSNT